MKFLPLPKPPEIPIEEKQIHALFGFKIENGVPVEIEVSPTEAVRRCFQMQRIVNYFHNARYREWTK